MQDKEAVRQRLLDRESVVDGRIVQTGAADLAARIENEGYDAFRAGATA